MASNLIQPFHFLSRSAISVTSGTIVYTGTRKTLDTADFDGIQNVYLDVNATNPSTTTVLNVKLKYWTGSAWADVDATNAKIDFPANTSTMTLMRSNSFALISGATIYAIEVTGSGTAAVVYDVKMLLHQDNATKSVFEIPLVSHVYNTATTGDLGATMPADAIYNGAIGTFGIFSSERQDYFQWLTSRYGDTISDVKLQVVHRCTSASYAGNYRLYNVTDSSVVVTGTQISTTTLTYEELDLDSQTNFHSGDTFRIEHAAAGGTTARTHELYSANVMVKVTNLNKGECYYRVFKGKAAATAAITNIAHQRTRITHSAYSSPVLYHELTGYCADAATAVHRLQNDATDNSGTSGWSVYDTKVWNTATKTLYRSSALSLPTDDYRWVYDTVLSTNNNLVAQAFIVVAFGAAPTPVAQTLVPTYDIIQFVNQSLAPTYNVAQLLAQTLVPTYGINTLVAQTLVPTYALQQLIAQTLAPTYDLKQLIAQTLVPVYDILPGVTAVAQTLVPTYDLRQLVAQTLAGTYDVRQLAAQTLVPTYALRQLVAQSLTPAYDLRQLVAQSLVPTYNVIQWIAQTLVPTYQLNNLVSKTLVPTYDLQQLASQTFVPTYAIRQFASQTLVPTYNLRQLIAQELVPAYDVRSLRSKTLVAVYDIEGIRVLIDTAFIIKL